MVDRLSKRLLKTKLRYVYIIFGLLDDQKGPLENQHLDRVTSLLWPVVTLCNLKLPIKGNFILYTLLLPLL